MYEAPALYTSGQRANQAWFNQFGSTLPNRVRQLLNSGWLLAFCLYEDEFSTDTEIYLVRGPNPQRFCQPNMGIQVARRVGYNGVLEAPVRLRYCPIQQTAVYA